MTLTGKTPVAAKRQRIAEAKTAKANTFGTLTELFLAASENNRLAEQTMQGRRWLLNKHILPKIKTSNSMSLIGQPSGHA